MNTQSISFLKGLILLLVLGVISVLLIKGKLEPSIAQSTEERDLEDAIPKHLPIKVRIKEEKEKAFKDLKNQRWARDMEIEVTNTGNKPIYYFRLSMQFPDVKSDAGYPFAFIFEYGRPALMDMKTGRAQPEDLPIAPGHKVSFILEQKFVDGWEDFETSHNRTDPEKVRLLFHTLSFGDGTGFTTTGGVPVPRKKASITNCAKANEEQLAANKNRGRPPSSIRRAKTC
jgi:hypothetical protein